MKVRKHLVCALLLVFSTNTFAQAFWDLRQISTSKDEMVKLTKSDGVPYANIQTAGARQIIEIVDKYSLLSNIYPTVYLKESDDFNAGATYVDSKPIIVIQKPMYDILIQDKGMMAALIGHELAHLYFKHGDKRAEAQQAGEILGLFVGSLLEAFFIGKFGVVGLGANIGGAVSSSIKGANSRPQESEADKQGMIWAIQSGYDPYGASRLFKEMEQRGGNSVLPFLSSHPNPADRFNDAIVVADLYSKYKNLEVVESPELLALNQKVDEYWQSQLPKSDAAIAGVSAYSKKDYSSAIENFKICSQAGEGTCTNNLGVIYLFALGVPQDKVKATAYFKEAVTQGSSVAKLNYARAILRGDEGVIDTPKAMKYLSESASEGIPEAMGTVAAMGPLEGIRREVSQYIPPKEVLVNYAKVSSMRGSNDGIYALALFNLKGYGISKNVDYAEVLIQRLYGRGYPKSNGLRYALYGLEKKDSDRAEGIKNEIISKKQVLAMPMVMMDYCMASSEFKNPEKCYEWVGILAKTGNPGAAYSYGMLKHEGVGTEKDQIEGAAWVNYSATKGWQLALKAVEAFRSRFSAEDVEKIVKRTAEIQDMLQKSK